MFGRTSLKRIWNNIFIFYRDTNGEQTMTAEFNATQHLNLAEEFPS